MVWQWALQVQGADWVYQDGRRTCGAVGGQGGLPLAGSCLEKAFDWSGSGEDSRWNKSKLIPTITAKHEQDWHLIDVIDFNLDRCILHLMIFWMLNSMLWFNLFWVVSRSGLILTWNMSHFWSPPALDVRESHSSPSFALEVLETSIFPSSLFNTTQNEFVRIQLIASTSSPSFPQSTESISVNYYKNVKTLHNTPIQSFTW